MIALYQFLGTYEVLIYFVLAIGAAFGLRWSWRAWNEWRHARYSLEREFALRRLGQAVAALMLVVGLFCLELFTATFAVPGLPASVVLPTGTLDVFATPTGTISAELATQLALTPRPEQGGGTGQGCIADKIEITSPKAGSEIQGTVDIVGSANVTDFGFYKYEVAPRGSDTWGTISAGRDKVKNGSLGQWDTTALAPGDYSLRLVVSDNQGRALPACVIQIRIMPPS
jgi:hypothetical protein